MKVSLPASMSVSSLAEHCRIHRASMYRALNEFDPVTLVHNCGPELAADIHRATAGEIPCWVLRPDLWAPGQVPPCLLDLDATA